MTETDTPEATELMHHDRERLEEVINELQAINSRIADIELEIRKLEEAKEELMEQKEEAEESKEDRFQDILARYELNPESDYTYQDGKVVEAEERELSIE